MRFSPPSRTQRGRWKVHGCRCEVAVSTFTSPPRGWGFSERTEGPLQVLLKALLRAFPQAFPQVLLQAFDQAFSQDLLQDLLQPLTKPYLKSFLKPCFGP